jgi:MFS family permease
MASGDLAVPAATARSSGNLDTHYETDFSTAETPAISRTGSFQKEIEEKNLEQDGQQTPAAAPSVNDVEKGEPQLDTAEGQSPVGRTVRGLKWFFVCLAIYISAFLYGLDTTIAADVQAPVIEQFGHVDQISWIGAGFPLGSVAVILFIGGLYGHFDYKWIYGGSVLLFEVGSTICGAAPNMNALIVGRVIAGMGGSGIYLGALNYFSALTTPEERGFYISLTGFFWGLGAVLGPIIGGAFAVSSATWRWAFYINLVVGAAVSWIYVFLLPSLHPNASASIKERLMHFDWLGLLLHAAIWGLFTVGFSFAGSVWQWNEGRTIAIIVVWGVVWILFALQQYFAILTTKENRAFPVHLLMSRTQLALYVQTAAVSAGLFVVVYFIPIYFQFVHNDSAIQAAVRLLPYIIILVTVNVFAGFMLSKIRYYMPVYLIAGILVTIGGTLLQHYLDPSTPEANIYGFTVLSAFGTGLTIQLGYAVATLTVKPQDIVNAINLQNVSQIGSTVIGLVIGGLVFQTYAVRNLNDVLAGHGYSAAEIAGAVAGTQSALFGELTGELRDMAIQAIVSAMQKSFILVIVSGATMIVTSLVMKRERLFGEVVTA